MSQIRACEACNRTMKYRGYGGDTGTVRQRDATTCMRCHVAAMRGPNPAIVGGRPSMRAPFLVDDGIVDDVAVRRAAAGDRTLRLTHREIVAAVAQLRRHGHSLYDMADVLGVTQRSVERFVAENSRDDAA